jgi:hypothetical protein
MEAVNMAQQLQDNEAVPQQFTHSVKIESTQKGLRVHVSAHANDADETIREVIYLYQKTKSRLEELNETIAPMNGVV